MTTCGMVVTGAKGAVTDSKSSSFVVSEEVRYVVLVETTFTV